MEIQGTFYSGTQSLPQHTHRQTLWKRKNSMQSALGSWWPSIKKLSHILKWPPVPVYSSLTLWTRKKERKRDNTEQLRVVNESSQIQQECVHTPRTWIKCSHTSQTQQECVHTPRTWVQCSHIWTKFSGCMAHVSKQWTGAKHSPFPHPWTLLHCLFQPLCSQTTLVIALVKYIHRVFGSTLSCPSIFILNAFGKYPQHKCQMKGFFHTNWGGESSQGENSKSGNFRVKLYRR